MEVIQAESTLTTASGPRMGHPRLSGHSTQQQSTCYNVPRHLLDLLGSRYGESSSDSQGKRKASNPCSPTLALVVPWSLRVAGDAIRMSRLPTPDSRDHLFPIDFDITSHSRSYTDTPRVKVALVQGPKLLVPRSSGRLQLPPRSRDCMALLKADYLRAELQGNHTHSPTPHDNARQRGLHAALTHVPASVLSLLPTRVCPAATPPPHAVTF